MSYVSFFDFNLEKSSFLYKTLDKKDGSRLKAYPNFTAKKDGDNIKINVWGEMHEDWTFEVKSNFQSYAEAVGGVSSIASSLNDTINKLRNASSLASGKMNSTSDYNKFMVWKDTEPMTMSTKIVFETKTNPYWDVFMPTMLLLSRTTLTPQSEDSNTMIVPGFFVGVFKTSVNAKGETVSDTSPPNTNAKRTDANYQAKINELIEKAEDNGKLLNSFNIGFRELGENDSRGESKQIVEGSTIGYNYKSLISFSPAFISSVKPTFSKDRTTSGVPLRAEVEVSVQSLFSASDIALNTLTPSSTRTVSSDFVNAAVNIFR